MTSPTSLHPELYLQEADTSSRFTLVYIRSIQYYLSSISTSRELSFSMIFFDQNLISTSDPFHAYFHKAHLIFIYLLTINYYFRQKQRLSVKHFYKIVFWLVIILKFRAALGPTQPRGDRGIFFRGWGQSSRGLQLAFHLLLVGTLRKVDLYLHSTTRLHGLVLNWEERYI